MRFHSLSFGFVGMEGAVAQAEAKSAMARRSFFMDRWLFYMTRDSLSPERFDQSHHFLLRAVAELRLDLDDPAVEQFVERGVDDGGAVARAGGDHVRQQLIEIDPPF